MHFIRMSFHEHEVPLEREIRCVEAGDANFLVFARPNFFLGAPSSSTAHNRIISHHNSLPLAADISAVTAWRRFGVTGDVELMIFGVHPDVRGAGIARKLLRLFEEYVMNPQAIEERMTTITGCDCSHSSVRVFAWLVPRVAHLYRDNGWREANELEYAEWDARASAERSIETPVKHYVPASVRSWHDILKRAKDASTKASLFVLATRYEQLN